MLHRIPGEFHEFPGSENSLSIPRSTFLHVYGHPEFLILCNFDQPDLGNDLKVCHRRSTDRLKVYVVQLYTGNEVTLKSNSLKCNNSTEINVVLTTLITTSGVQKVRRLTKMDIINFTDIASPPSPHYAIWSHTGPRLVADLLARC